MPSSVRKINLKTSKCPLAHFPTFSMFIDLLLWESRDETRGMCRARADTRVCPYMRMSR